MLRSTFLTSSNPINIPTTQEKRTPVKHTRFDTVEHYSYNPPAQLHEIFNQQSLPTFSIADINSDDDEIYKNSSAD